MKQKKTQKARTRMPKVTFEGKGGNLSTYAGLIPIMKFLEQLGFRHLFESTVEHTRGDSATYHLVDAVEMTLLGAIAGACNLEAVIRVWGDTVLRRLGGWQRIMDATTMGRLFKSLKSRHINDLETFIHILRGRVWKRSKKFIGGLLRHPLWIDVDSTVKTVYGKQEGAEVGYNPKNKGAKSYNPQLAFCAATKEILQGWLRPGNTYTSNGILEFMKQLVSHLPKDLRIIFRGDSGYFVGPLLDWLDQRGDGYLIKVKLKGLAGLLSRQIWTDIPDKPGWQQCIFLYACRTWGKKRRFIAVRKRIEKARGLQVQLLDLPDYDDFCYVTTENLSPWLIHKKYGERATCETWIDEAKNQMGLAHMKTNQFLANAALFQSAILAYNTVRWMALVRDDKNLLRWEMASIRSYMIRMAGKLVTGGRQLKLLTPCELLYPKQWEAWLSLSTA